MKAEKFIAKLTSGTRYSAWTFIKLPVDAAKTWGSKGRISVKGTINGFAFRTSIFPDGKGKHSMMVNKQMQKGGNVKPGETASFVIEPDTKPRVVSVPADLKKALAQEPDAAQLYKKFSPSHKKEFVDWITQAKKPETRAARVAKTIKMILEKSRLG